MFVGEGCIGEGMYSRKGSSGDVWCGVGESA